MRPVHHLLALHLHAIHNLRWPADSEQVMEQGDTGGKEQTLPPPHQSPSRYSRVSSKRGGPKTDRVGGGESTSSELGNHQVECLHKFRADKEGTDLKWSLLGLILGSVLGRRESPLLWLSPNQDRERCEARMFICDGCILKFWPLVAFPHSFYKGIHYT